MQKQTLIAALQGAARAPALAGIYIKSVSLSAVRNVWHDPIMTIIWSMLDHTSAVDIESLPGIAASCLSRPSDTSIALPREMVSPAEIEDAVLAAAWELGAWDLCRIERAPQAEGADWHDARHGITSSFGHNDYIIGGQPMVMGARAGDNVCEIAAREGYITWRFVPLALATPSAKRQWVGKDKTLQYNGTRLGAPGAHRGAWHLPEMPHTANEHQYQLGRSNHGNRNKKNSGRNAKTA